MAADGGAGAEREGQREVAAQAPGCEVDRAQPVVDMALVEQLRASVRQFKLALVNHRVTTVAEAVAIAYLLREPSCRISALSIQDTQFEDFAPIAEALKTNDSLMFLNVRRSNVSDVGMLAEALRVNTSLRELVLAQTPVSSVGELVDALRVNRDLIKLDMECCILPEDERALLLAVAQEKEAEGLEFSLNIHVDDPSTDEEGQVEVTVQTLGGEAALPRSRVPAELTVGELALRLVGPAGNPAEAPELVLGSRPLARGERLGDLEAERPEQGLVLTLLRPIVNVALIDRMRARVGNFKLRIDNEQQITKAEATAIAYLLGEPSCRISELQIRGTEFEDFTPIAEALKANDSVMFLDLRRTNVSDVRVLAEAVRVNTGLRKLVLAETAVSSLGELVDALRVNQDLIVLDLDGCTQVTEVDAALLRALQLEKEEDGSEFSVCLPADYQTTPCTIPRW